MSTRAKSTAKSPSLIKPKATTPKPAKKSQLIGYSYYNSGNSKSIHDLQRMEIYSLVDTVEDVENEIKSNRDVLDEEFGVIVEVRVVGEYSTSDVNVSLYKD